MSSGDGPRCCPTCGAKVVEYRHSLGAGIVKALAEFYYRNKEKPGKPTDIPDLTHNQLGNWQKLRYWGLIAKADDGSPSGAYRGGWWRVTGLGEAFLREQLQIQEKAVTARARVTRNEGRLVWIGDVVDGYKYRGDYAIESQPANADQTPSLFGEAGL